MRSNVSENTTDQVIDDRANLTIIARNTAPIREELYPCTWMLYSGGQAIRLHVAHDLALHPHVEDRCASVAGSTPRHNSEVFTDTRKPEAVSLPLVMTDLMLASWETISKNILLISQNQCSQAEYLSMFSEKAAAAMATWYTLMSSYGQASIASLMAPWLSRASANAKRLRKK